MTLAEKPPIGRAGQVAESTTIETEEVQVSVGEADAASRGGATVSGKQIAATPAPVHRRGLKSMQVYPCPIKGDDHRPIRRGEEPDGRDVYIVDSTRTMREMG